MTTQKISADQQVLLTRLAPLISDYITETKLPTTLEAYLRELSFVQIVIDGKLVGFWGGRIRSAGAMKLLTIKALYLHPKYRGKYLNSAGDSIFNFAERQGVTDLEIWNYPSIQVWFQRRYRMEPKIYVTFNALSKFRL